MKYLPSRHPPSSRKSTPDSYADQLISEGLMTEEECGAIRTAHYGMLNDKLANMTLYSPPPTNLQVCEVHSFHIL